MKTISILHVIPSADRTLGGPIEGVLQLNRVLTQFSHDSEIVSLDDPNASWLQDMPLKVHALGPGVTGYRYARAFIPWMRQNAQRYDYVIVNGIWQYHSFATRRALRPLGIPYTLYTHGMLDPWFKKTYPLKHLKKCLYWPWGEYPVLRDAQAVCFTCEEERVLARQSFSPFRWHEAVVNYGTSVPTGDPDAQRRAFYNAHPALWGKRLLLFLSRIQVKKGCDLLLDAFAQVAASDPALHLVMAGPDQTGWMSQLQAQAQRLGIADRVIWPGMLSGDLKWGAFHAADAFVLPSHQENFGIAVAEALACGLPVLISDKVNIWREIQTDRAGLVAEDTVEGTTCILQDWLALSPADRDAMRQRAVDCFTTRFEITNAATSLLGVLRGGPPSKGEFERKACPPWANMKTVDLSSYENPPWHDKGRGFVTRAVWHIVNAAFLQNPLNPSSGVKVRLLRLFGARIGTGVLLKPGINVKSPWLLEIGDHSWVGERAWLDTFFPIKIGPNVCISQDAYLCTGNHDWTKTSFDLIDGSLTIEGGAWVGARATILPGAHIASHTVIAGGAVLSKPTEPYTVYAGNPAVPIRKRVIE